MKSLPIGIQTFRKMIRENHLYIDKTREILRLINSGSYLFLSRPRRFGKSLLVSALYEIFSGNRELFQGLFIYDQLDWQAYPVIHLDLSRISYDDDLMLQQSLSSFLTAEAQRYNIELTTEFLKDRFFELIAQLHTTTGQPVVILIDEYDKPIIDHLNNLEKAANNRAVLREFYGVLKSADPHLHFVFLTGVSKFSRVSIFSGLNNLQDMTLAPQCATLLGYTQAELEAYFDEYLTRFCQAHNLTRPDLLAKIREWYNGYSWNAVDRVYNPFSILNLFAHQRFSNYWFASGTPTFLIDQITRLQVDTTEFEGKRIPELVFDSYDLERMNVFALMFQTGYLTITGHEEDEGSVFTLDYPNLEVKHAFLTYLVEALTTARLDEVQIWAQELRRALRAENFEGFMTIIRALFAKIPYPLHLPEEAYYHSLFYMILSLMGVDIDLEVLTDKGRIDGVLALEEKIYLIEFKYAKAGSKLGPLTAKAIRQMRAKQYADRFRNDPRPRLLLGIGVAGKEIGYQLERV